MVDSLLEESERGWRVAPGLILRRVYFEADALGFVLVDGDRLLDLSMIHLVDVDSAGCEEPLEPGSDDGRRFLRFLEKLGETVEQVEILRTGEATIVFADGSRIVAAPHPEFEAWQLSGSSGVFGVSPAGGTEPS